MRTTRWLMSAWVVAVTGAAAAPTSAAGATQAEPIEEIDLPEALRRLEADNLTLAQVRSRAEEARASSSLAAVPLMPTVGVNGSYTRNSDQARISLADVLSGIESGLSRSLPIPVRFDRTNLPPDTVIQPLEMFTAAASVRVPLFVPQSYWELAAARAAAEASEAAAGAARLQLRLALVQAAWGAAATEEVVEAAERAVETAREHAQSASRSLKAGTGSPLARLQADTERVRRESELERARSERSRAQLAAGILLGRARPVRIRIAEPARAPVPESPQVLVDEALSRRPELAGARAAARAAEHQRTAAWWRLAPQLSAGATAFASDVPYPTGENAGWRATLELSWLLYDGGAGSGRRAQAQAAMRTSAAALEAQRLDVMQQVLDAAREIEVARERLRLAERQRELAEQAARVARRSYEAGITGSLEVIDANDRVYGADVALADARARLGVARAALERSTGRL